MTLPFDELSPADYAEHARTDPLMGGYVMHTYKDLDQVEHWLEKLTFIPSSRLFAELVHHQIQLRMVARVFDSTSKMPVHVEHMVNWPHVASDGSYTTTSDAMFGQVIKVTTTTMLPAYLPEQGEDLFRHFVRQWLHDWMKHEADEWLKDRESGQPLFDPHARVEVRSVGHTPG